MIKANTIANVNFSSDSSLESWLYRYKLTAAAAVLGPRSRADSLAAGADFVAVHAACLLLWQYPTLFMMIE